MVFKSTLSLWQPSSHVSLISYLPAVTYKTSLIQLRFSASIRYKTDDKYGGFTAIKSLSGSLLISPINTGSGNVRREICNEEENNCRWQKKGILKTKAERKPMGEMKERVIFWPYNKGWPGNGLGLSGAVFPG